MVTADHLRQSYEDLVSSYNRRAWKTSTRFWSKVISLANGLGVAPIDWMEGVVVAHILQEGSVPSVQLLSSERGLRYYRLFKEQHAEEDEQVDGLERDMLGM